MMNTENIRDITIIKVLNDPKNKEYLIRIIHKLTGIDKDVLKSSLIYLPRNVSKNVNIKSGEVDNLLYTNDTYIDIEVNTSNNKISKSKNLSYVCHLILRQTKIGESYNIKKVCQINIDTYDYLKENRFIYKCLLKEDKSNEVVDDRIIIYHINLKYLKEKEDTEILKMDMESLERLLYILVCNDKTKLEKIYQKDKVMIGIMKDFDFVNDEFDKMLIYNREDYIKAVAKEDGIIEGLCKGQKQGLIQGQKQGLIQGKKQNQLVVIKNMLKDNLPLSTIKKYLNISNKELEEIMKEI